MNLICLSGGWKSWTLAQALSQPPTAHRTPPPHLVSRRWPHRHTAIRIWNAKHKVTEKDRCHLIHYRLLNTSSKHQSAGQRAPTALEGRWDWCGCWWQQWWQSREAWLRRTHATRRPPIFLFTTSQPRCLCFRRSSEHLKKRQKERPSALKTWQANKLTLQENQLFKLCNSAGNQHTYHTTTGWCQSLTCSVLYFLYRHRNGDYIKTKFTTSALTATKFDMTSLQVIFDPVKSNESSYS